MKKIYILAVLISCSFISEAQQEAMFTHYAFNTQSVNPAYAGNRGVFSTSLIHRSQWVGFDGAPMTQCLVFSTPLLNNMLGVGGSLQNDRIGPLNIFSGNIDFAYKLKINRKSRLSFGIKAGINYYDRNLNDLLIHEQGDYAVENNSSNQMIYDIGAGLLYTNKRFYVGVSSPRLFNTHFDNLSTVETLAEKEKQHLYVTMGTAFDINKKVECKPSAFMKRVEGSFPQFDLTTMFVFNKAFEVGAMWRSSDAAGILIGYTINRNFRIGYSFDWSYGNRTFQYNFGSHELMLRYELFKKGGDDIISPRYF